MNKKNIISLFIFVALIAWSIYRYENKTNLYSRQEFALDTLVEISFEGKTKEGEAILDSVFMLIDQLDSDYSYYKSDSKVSKLNDSNTYDEFDENLQLMYNLAKEFYNTTNGKYNIAIGQLTDIWDYENEIIPDDKQVKNALEQIDFNNIKVQGLHIEKSENIKLNFGSIAKGMIVDKATEFLLSKGIESGIINAGGDMRVLNSRKAVRIGIQHPRGVRNEVINVISLNNAAVVTSGDYERYFINDGIRYHHILDPDTGYPADNCISATVITTSNSDAENSTEQQRYETMRADAISTVLFLLKPFEAISFVDQQLNTEAVIYYYENDEIKLMTSRGMNTYLEEGNNYEK